MRRFCFVALLASLSPAQDAYYEIPLREIVAPDSVHGEWSRRAIGRQEMAPRVVLAGPGEALCDFGTATWIQTPRQYVQDGVLHVRAPAGKELAAKLYVPAAGWNAMDVHEFVLRPAQAKVDGEQRFLTARAAHLRALMARNLPGSAWFRRQLAQVEKALGTSAETPAEVRPNRDVAEETFDLFMGGRALAENLQLDRVLQPAGGGEEEVELESIKGLTVKELDWAPRIRGKQPSLDPLAAQIPHDQHAIFFPSFTALLALADEAERSGTPVLQMLEPRGEDAQVASRYERQLCLAATGIGRLVGPQVIESVAITGSDPYLRMGADVAVLFAAKDVAGLRTLLGAQLALRAKGEPGAKRSEGEIAGIRFESLRSPDRRVCAYIATLGTTVVVTNSPAQLQRLAEVGNRQQKSLAELPEFTFFRDRYPRGDAQETALLVLSDATIRRWCSPRWRIADSRRTRAAALLAELQAREYLSITAGIEQPRSLQSDLVGFDLGALKLTRDGVESGLYGSLAFMTPIAELPFGRATKAEAETYERWRSTYQRYWSQFFDPIAIRFSLAKDRLAADVTVMPLILASDYAEFEKASKGARLNAQALDEHDSLGMFALAVNPKSEPMQDAERLAREFSGKAKVDLLGWFGGTLSLCADADPFWDEIQKATDPDEFLQKNWHRLPLMFRFESVSALKLAAFLTALRAFISGASPGLLDWETLEHEGQPYVRIRATEEGRRGERFLGKLNLCYAATADAWAITLNEDMLKRALSRQAARRAETASRPARDLPGENVYLRVDSRFVEPWRGVVDTEWRRQAQNLAWANLPILEEWHRLLPDQDPVAVHEKLWHTKLICPGGGRYVWNHALGVMESTAFGSPLAPKPGPESLGVLHGLLGGEFGLTFEPDGLRARGTLLRR